jgi:cyclopropane fatty-acyl-phospholipid synthase-like methyltransferase
MSETDFYAGYGAWKKYETPALKAKHIRRLDRDVWIPAEMRADHTVLEIGCGTGQVLAYLAHKGVRDFTGIDQDPKLADVIPASARDRFVAAPVERFLDRDARRFDRILLFDVLEHFSPPEGAELLKSLRTRLKPDGALVIKLPNMSSPWGMQHQFGDLTHRAAYTPGSLRQLCGSCGYGELTCRAQITGSPFRRFADPLVHRLLGRLIMTPPEIWSANFIAVVRRGRD